MWPLLDPVEQARCAGFAEQADRDRFAVTHGIARLILASHLSVAPQRIRWRIGRWGKPGLDLPGAPEVNLSHSGDLALVAVASRPVGVDVELVRARWRTNPPTRFLHPHEARMVAAADPACRAELFGQTITRKEACVKAEGGKLLGRLTTLSTVAPPLPDGSRVIRADTTSWRVVDLRVPAGYRAAVGVTGADSCRVVHECWDA